MASVNSAEQVAAQVESIGKAYKACAAFLKDNGMDAETLISMTAEEVDEIIILEVKSEG